MSRKRMPKFIPWTAENIWKLAKHVGGQAKLAELLKVNVGTVSQWVTDNQKPNPASWTGLNFVAQRKHFKLEE